jgi:hypothetical protein
MARFVSSSPGLQEPLRAHLDPTLPTLPDLKKRARDRRAAGLVAVDQSAGDIDDVGQPLHPDFPAWVEQTRQRLVSAGQRELRPTSGDAYGYPGHYQQQYPAVVEILADSWGLGPHQAVQTVSGRNALDLAMRGLVSWARAQGRPGPHALVLDPLAWPGYLPLAEDLGLALIHAPAHGGLAATADGVREAAHAARAQGLDPIAALPIVPSNPSGVGLDSDTLCQIVQLAEREAMLVLLDAFYSPLSPGGHASAVPVADLRARLSPELLGRIGVLVGETKVTSSQNKTSTLFWLAPAGEDRIARIVIGAALERLKTTNTYPRPQEAVVAAALHTFPGGLQAAMGPRFQALDAARNAMAAVADSRGLPLSIGGSFYGTLGLVDAQGQGLLRDADGRPLTRPKEILEALAGRYGLIGAPGGLFSPAPEASLLVRLTAAVSLEDIGRLDEILGALQDGGAR